MTGAGGAGRLPPRRWSAEAARLVLGDLDDVSVDLVKGVAR
jgi:hypothetical protein